MEQQEKQKNVELHIGDKCKKYVFLTHNDTHGRSITINKHEQINC